MKKSLLVISLLLNYSLNAQTTVAEYTDFLKLEHQSPIDYILGLFEDNDIIILGERDHRDTTQYDLILEIIKDKRFIENIGHVYTEVGVVNQSEWANKLVKGSFVDNQEFDAEFVRLYRELDFNPLWDKYNMIKYLKGIYEINKNLEPDKKVTIGLTDCAFDWKGMTHEKYIGFKNRSLKGLNTRDSLMANNFIQLYEKQIQINGHKKALLIQSRPHAINLDINYKGKAIKKTGAFIKDKYREKVKIVAFNWYKWLPPEWSKWMPEHSYGLTDNGKWDAAYEISGKPTIGFSIKNTPFGLAEFDYTYEQGIKYQDLIDGIIFYLPFYEFICTRGLPGIVDVEFAKEYIERIDIVYGNSDYSKKYTPEDEKRDWEEFNGFDCNDYELFKKQMNYWLKDRDQTK